MTDQHGTIMSWIEGLRSGDVELERMLMERMQTWMVRRPIVQAMMAPDRRDDVVLTFKACRSSESRRIVEQAVGEVRASDGKSLGMGYEESALPECGDGTLAESRQGRPATERVRCYATYLGRHGGERAGTR
jgi:hypothetical protein